MIYTYKVSYIDTLTNGNWKSTMFSSSEPKTNEFLIDFFGLKDSNVQNFKIEDVTNGFEL